MYISAQVYLIFNIFINSQVNYVLYFGFYWNQVIISYSSIYSWQCALSAYVGNLVILLGCNIHSYYLTLILLDHSPPGSILTILLHFLILIIYLCFGPDSYAFLIYVTSVCVSLCFGAKMGWLFVVLRL